MSFHCPIVAKGLHWSTVFKRHHMQCVVQIETILIITYHSLGKDHKRLHVEEHRKQRISTKGNVRKIESCP